ncbi:ABC transporter ATP-binding protein, partial [bacterium]|nr:ABC transporter ATP-binding protein [bacterium]
AIARAIAFKPEIILYDEPTTGLDPITADAIDDLIKDLNNQMNVTSVVVTHDIRSANRIADRMAMIYNGKIVAQGTPEQMRQSEVDVVRRFVR